jgi:hypothetical protein
VNEGEADRSRNQRGQVFAVRRKNIYGECAIFSRKVSLPRQFLNDFVGETMVASPTLDASSAKVRAGDAISQDRIEAPLINTAASR